MEITKQQIENLVGLLNRVQLTGNEVPAFNELTNLLKKEYEAQDANKKASGDVPADSKPKESK